MFSTFSLKRAHDKAEADVVFDMPISPKTNKSQLDGTESKPVCIADITSSLSIAKFSEKSFVGSSKSNGITFNFRPASSHN